MKARRAISTPGFNLEFDEVYISAFASRESDREAVVHMTLSFGHTDCSSRPGGPPAGHVRRVRSVATERWWIVKMESTPAWRCCARRSCASDYGRPGADDGTFIHEIPLHMAARRAATGRRCSPPARRVVDIRRFRHGWCRPAFSRVRRPRTRSVAMERTALLGAHRRRRVGGSRLRAASIPRSSFVLSCMNRGRRSVSEPRDGQRLGPGTACGVPNARLRCSESPRKPKTV